MTLEVANYSHSVGEFNFHIQLTPAFRRPIFIDSRIRRLVKAYLLEKANDLKVKIVAVDFGPDHLHFFVVNCKNYAPKDLVQYFKGYVSRMMRKNHRDLFRHFLFGKKFWNSGYFCRSIGATTTEAVKYYIEKSQQKHWTIVDYDVQRELVDFD